MNWDSAWLTTKVVLYLLVGLVFSAASAVAAVCLGGLFLMLLGQAGQPQLGIVACLCIALTVFMGGNFAGKQAMRSEGLVRFFFDAKDLDEMQKGAKEG